MKASLLRLLLLAAAVPATGAALGGVDSVVTFNELQYHPAPGQAGSEWIELRNQNSTDVDLSGWRLDGGVDYVFPPGAVIRGGRYVVIAADPAALAAATGLGGILGPFRNALDNAGESVTLKNNNGRRMDEIDYRDDQPWPAAADGSGATLAKFDEMKDSGSPENWRASLDYSGTPGRYNFTAPVSGAPIPLTGDPGPVLRYYRMEGDTADSSGRNVPGTGVNAPAFSDEHPPLVGSGQSLDCNGSNQYVNIPDSAQPVAYTVSVWVRPDLIRAQSIVLRTNSSGPTTRASHQIRMNAQGLFEHVTFDTSPRIVTGSTVALAGQWYHVAITAANGETARLYVNGTEEGTPVPLGTVFSTGTRWMVGSNSSGAAYFDGLIDEVAIWHGPMNASQVGQIATGLNTPLDAVSINLALGRPVIAGSGAYPDLPFNGGTAPANHSALKVTDGSASDTPGSSYWLGREGQAQEHFILDLGRLVDISAVHLRNTHNGSMNDRGTGNFRLLGSTAIDADRQLTGAAQILAGTLTTRSVDPPAPANSPVPADVFTVANGLTPVTARYLRFESLSSAYGGNVGLNEIEVYGTARGGQTGGRPQALSLVINEITPATAPGAWVELHNYGSAPLDLTGFLLESSTGASWTLPPVTLASGGFLLLEEAVTGLHPESGDRLFLYAPEKSAVLDGVVVRKEKHRLREPAAPGGSPGPFLTAETAADITPGAQNHIEIESPVVINEIMFHHRPQFLPYTENSEEWIELFNRSAAPVNLAGWQLDNAISYTFPAGTVLAPGAWLCVSNDAVAFSAAHPGIPVLGNFSGGLSNRGERILLRNAAGNPVDDVYYRDKEPWPIYADGLGSSLELKNPHADNSVPESWASSDESLRSTWKDYSYTATAVTPRYSPTITNTGTTAFHELRMGLLEEGEVLVDDVSVREITSLPDRELIQNGSFSAGTAATWRLLGNHETSVVTGDAGNPALLLRASGPLLYMHNLTETTFKSGTAIVPVVNGRQYRISLRAKWLRGCPWLHTEIYYNKVASSFLLDLPAVSGTPGALNSVYVANTGPTFTGTVHSPVLPAAGQPITVRTRVADPDGVAAVKLNYSISGGVLQSLPMTQGADGRWAAEIPGQTASAITQFFVEGVDGAANPVTATWPAAGKDSRALIKANDGASVNSLQNLRVITTTADANLLASQVHIMSNRRRGCTIIHNDSEVFYDAKIRLRGSMFSRGAPATAGESLTFPADHLYRGTQRTISVRRGGIEEIVVKHAINAAGGLPDNYNDIINLISFRSDARGPARVEMERFSNSWLDEFYPDGSEGTLFKMEGIRVPTQTFANGSIPAGNAEGIKNLTTSGIGWVGDLDIADLGPDGEQYRHSFRWLNNFSRNDNARFVTLSRAFSLPTGTPVQQLAFEQTIEPLMDVDEWMRTFAMMSLFGINDAYSQGNPHNLNFYMPPTPDGRISAIPWDWNFVFNLSTSAPLTGGSNIQKVINRPRFKRLFLGNLKHIIDTTFNPAYLTPWFDHYGALAGTSYSSYTSNVNSRRTYVLAQINTQLPRVDFAVTTSGGADFTTDGASAVLEGTGWIDVHGIRLNGSPDSLPVTWLDQRNWRVVVPLGPGDNPITLTATDRRGVEVGTDSLTIRNNSSILQAATANTVISKVHYHPAAADGQEFIEIMNISPSHSVSLQGCAFTDGFDYSFPDDAVIPPGGRRVVTSPAFLNGTALSNGGERITLSAPGGMVIRSFVYSDLPPWPAAADGAGPGLVLIAPRSGPDHTVAANWRLSSADGGSPGIDDSVPFTGNPMDDDDGDGVVKLVEYALGVRPRLTALAGPVPSFTVSRVDAADDADVTGEVSSALSGWKPAELTSRSAGSLTFAPPAELLDQGRLFFRSRVTLRPR